jgi:hypothetical protein
LVSLAALAALFAWCEGCGDETLTPCQGTVCAPVSGKYKAVYSPLPACELWTSDPLPVSTLVVSTSEGKFTVFITPGDDGFVHTLQGTLTAQRTVFAQENVNSFKLEVSRATFVGTFNGLQNPDDPPYFFTGAVSLHGPRDDDGGTSCQTTVQVRALQQALLDGGF